MAPEWCVLRCPVMVSSSLRSLLLSVTCWCVAAQFCHRCVAAAGPRSRGDVDALQRSVAVYAVTCGTVIDYQPCAALRNVVSFIVHCAAGCVGGCRREGTQVAAWLRRTWLKRRDDQLLLLFDCNARVTSCKDRTLIWDVLLIRKKIIMTAMQNRGTAN